MRRFPARELMAPIIFNIKSNASGGGDSRYQPADRII
jgi:hypothetical protein